jgi:hypothetical protein
VWVLLYLYEFLNRVLKKGGKMYGRAGLERFRKAQTLEPFSVASKSSHKQTTEPLVSSIYPQPSHQETLFKNRLHDPQKPVGPEVMVSSVILCLIIHLYHASMQQLFSQEWKVRCISFTYFITFTLRILMTMLKLCLKRILLE